jgi:hypothetical protein
VVEEVPMRRTLTGAAAFAVGLFWIGVPASSQERPHADAHAHSTDQAQEEELKVGKKQEIAFRVETIVGDVTLAPGRYRIQHRVDGSDHFVRFTSLDKSSGEGAPEIKCRLEPLGEKAPKTTIFSRRRPTVST